MMSSVAPSMRALDYGFISTYLPQKVGVYYYLPDYRSRESAITVWRTPAEDYLPVGQMFSARKRVRSGPIGGPPARRALVEMRFN